MTDNFFFGALVYISLLLFFGGVLYRLFSGFKGSYRGKWDLTARGDLLWTARSTGFFGRTSGGVAALNFHWGFIILLVSHVIGFVGGAYGITVLVDLFRWVGMVGGIMVLYGLLVALWRRISNAQIRAMSSFEDYAVLILLILIVGLGLYQSAIKMVFGISYAVGPWFGGVFKFAPDASLVAGVPLLNKLHMILALVFFAYFPFTKLVHAVTFPINYLWRPYINLRSYRAIKK